MSDADARLKVLFAADEPAPRDPAFATAVMERLVRRRCLEDLSLLAAVSVLGGAVLWGLWPGLQPELVAMSNALAPAAGLLAAALCGVAIFAGRPAQAIIAES
ncbi:MAG TPA: hypothetical protein VLI41_08490 [Phenylobacterium sp.]|uniref:hypothetical protein n=1 Tax=Phenylobacterium sp. TaxID=1871053 RepID=UPI002C54CED1|nr:hypothetical protein [Phenylobacterium sp.]HSV03230.1 hypothetical protein [Phenylobacterium sp.]